ncbi:AraC family transcriptional regulator [Spirosoma rhododendri]|uniref:AraC family transcriptional regulator n=1 Tax=Spirosoma rhododendri TaxID=2728024 RepID=A0A7L5DME8_9BACT|nr:AraC family transcriptional regulator [Spirosoma rhododendri]QJD79295.1 AraC family transcriptional regulator [Spirosoma rhododendri]
MRQPLRKELEPVAASFLVKELVEPHFDPNWHFHPHYQLFLVKEGTGTRFIGDSISTFAPGDLVFLGPNLPHLWRSDQPYFDRQSTLRTQGIVVYFPEDFLGPAFFEKQEMSAIRQLLANARHGLTWSNGTHDRAVSVLTRLVSQPVGFGRLMGLLNLLNELAESTEYQLLASSTYVNSLRPEDTDRNIYHRMQVVHDYVLNHFPEELSLETVADLAGMTAPAFCRYFKARANKTFSEFVSEVRIGHACKLLMNTPLSITQVSFESGYRTLSNFNRQFKDITGLTPSGYVKTYRQL